MKPNKLTITYPATEPPGMNSNFYSPLRVLVTVLAIVFSATSKSPPYLEPHTLTGREQGATAIVPRRRVLTSLHVTCFQATL